jgi:hypothetical protein
VNGRRGFGRVVIATTAVLALLCGGVLVAVQAVAGASSLGALTDTTTTPDAPPPPTTIPVTTPEPEPAPMPGPKPKPVSKPPPKPTPKSAPKQSPAPVTPAPVTHSSSGANTNPSSPRVVRATRSTPGSKGRAVVRQRPIVRRKTAKPRRHNVHHAATTRTKPRNRGGQVLVSKTGGASSVAAVTREKANHARPLIFGLLCLSFLMLGIGATPVRSVPWRRAADVLEQRHGELTVSGIAFLAIALLTMLMARGF